MSRHPDPIAKRCAEIVTSMAENKGFVQSADPADFTASCESLTVLALRAIVDAASEAARQYAEECRKQGIQPLGHIMDLKVQDEDDLIEEAFAVSLHAPTNTAKLMSFRRELENRGLLLSFSRPPSAA
jgi:hypothetical protein